MSLSVEEILTNTVIEGGDSVKLLVKGDDVLMLVQLVPELPQFDRQTKYGGSSQKFPSNVTKFVIMQQKLLLSPPFRRKNSPICSLLKLAQGLLNGN